MCSQHSNTDVIWNRPALVERRAVIPFSKLMDFEPHVVLIKKTSNNQNQPSRLLHIRSNIISVLDRALYWMIPHYHSNICCWFTVYFTGRTCFKLTPVGEHQEKSLCQQRNFEHNDSFFFFQLFPLCLVSSEVSVSLDGSQSETVIVAFFPLFCGIMPLVGN